MQTVLFKTKRLSEDHIRCRTAIWYKANPSSVSQGMRAAKDNDGQRLFTSNEFPTTKQIASLFSPLAAKRNFDTDEELSDEEADETERQSALQELKDAVMSDVSIQHSHSIVFDCYNIYVIWYRNQSFPRFQFQCHMTFALHLVLTPQL